MHDDFTDGFPFDIEDEVPQSSPFEELKLQIEAILFASEAGLDMTELRSYLGEIALGDVRMALRDLAKDYESRAFFLFENNGKYQLRTKESYSDLIKKQYTAKPRSLSKSALETLAIVAYRQPVTRAEINAIRQVDSASILASLKERDLITITGQRKEVGSPMEYSTTPKFLETFGLNTLKDLPSLRSLQMSPEDQKQVQEAIASLEGREEPPPTPEELSFPEPVDGAAATADERPGAVAAPVDDEPTDEPSDDRPGASAAGPVLDSDEAFEGEAQAEPDDETFVEPEIRLNLQTPAVDHSSEEIESDDEETLDASSDEDTALEDSNEGDDDEDDDDDWDEDDDDDWDEDDDDDDDDEDDDEALEAASDDDTEAPESADAEESQTAEITEASAQDEPTDLERAGATAASEDTHSEQPASNPEEPAEDTPLED